MMLLGMMQNYCYFANPMEKMKTMKPYVILVFIMVLAGCSADRQDTPKAEESGEAVTEISFEKTEHDLGRILQGEKVGYNFRYTNVGESPLIILEARAGCGCTVPRFSKKPVSPGESGEIEVVFDSSGRIGQQNKIVSIRTNAGESAVQLTIKADIYRSDT